MKVKSGVVVTFAVFRAARAIRYGMIGGFGRDERGLLWCGLRRGAESSRICVVHRARNLRSWAKDGLVHRLVDGTLGLIGRLGCVVSLGLLGLLILRPIRHVLLSGGKEAVTGKGEGTDNEQAHKPDHGGNKDWYDLDEGGSAHYGTGLQAGVAGDGNRHAPPGEAGIETRSEQPRAKEVVNLGGFVAPLLWREDASNACKVNAAESDGKDA